MTARPAMLRLDQLEPHPENVREHLVDLDDLAASIRTHGLLQPIVVEPCGPGRYRLIAGHRRTAAARLAGMVTVPSVIRDDLLPEDVVASMLVENMQRAALTPLEEARALGRLREMGCDQADLARRVGKSVPWVSSRLMLLELPADQQEQVLEEYGVGEAQELVRRQRRAARGQAPDSKAQRGWDDSPWHLDGKHPLGAAAKHLCDQLGHNGRRRLRSTACGACWEDVIRADERRRAEGRAGLPPAPAPVPTATAGGPQRRDLDDVAVQRACDGDGSVKLGIGERRVAVQRLHGRGMSDGAIAERLGLADRTVWRIRQELGLPATQATGAA